MARRTPRPDYNNRAPIRQHRIDVWRGLIDIRPVGYGRNHLLKAVIIHGAVETRSDFLSLGADGVAGAARAARLRGALQSDAGKWAPRRTLRARPRSKIAALRASDTTHRGARVV